VVVGDRRGGISINWRNSDKTVMGISRITCLFLPLHSPHGRPAVYLEQSLKINTALTWRASVWRYDILNTRLAHANAGAAVNAAAPNMVAHRAEPGRLACAGVCLVDHLSTAVAAEKASGRRWRARSHSANSDSDAITHDIDR